MKHVQFVEKNKSLAWIRLNNSEKHNAFSESLLNELNETLKKIEQSNDFKVVVLSGEGKSFSSGVDLSELLKLDSVYSAKKFALLLEEVSERIFRFPKPVIVAMHGLVLGGAAGFSAAADIRIAAKDTKIGFPAVKLGAILPATCTVYVESLIGRGKTLDLTLTGKIISADEAFRMGLVDYVVNRENLDSFLMELAGKIMEGSSEALQLTKRTVNFSHQILLEQAKLYAADNFAYLSQTPEWKSRMKNFIQNKKK